MVKPQGFQFRFFDILYRKELFLLGLAFLWLLSNASAQSFLRYEIVDFKNKSGTADFPDSTRREVFVQDLLGKLHMEGYPSAMVRSKTFFGDSLSIQIDSGLLYQWITLNKGNLTGRQIIDLAFDGKEFRQKPLDFNRLKILFEKAINQAQNNGYPFASVRLDSIIQEGTQIQASINFTQGPLITFDTIQVLGNSKTAPIYLNRLLKIPPGAPFSQRKVDQAMRTIQGLPYIQVMGEPQLSFQNQEASLYLPLQDRRINTLDGIIGVLPNETEGNKLLVTGQFDLSLYNVAGKGRNYSLNWQRLSQYSQNLRISAEEPMLLGSLIDLKASFFLLKEDTTFLNRDFRIDLGYRISSQSYLSFFSRRQTGDLLAVSQWEGEEELPDIADFRFNNYGINFQMTTLDDIFQPRRGSLSQLEWGIGNKRLIENTALPTTLYQNIKLNSIQYYLTLTLEKHLFISQKFGLLFRTKAGEISNENLLLNDLYRLGGLKSIRGFNENFFFSNRYLFANFESRFYLDPGSYFLMFTDMGVLHNKVSGEGTDWPFSFGGGISLETNGGIFNFVYGMGQSNTQLLGFNYSKIHFGYIGRF